MHHGALTLPVLVLGAAALLVSAASGALAHSAGYLANETFRVVTIGETTVTTEQTLTFEVDGTVHGSTGCNTFSTGVRVDGHEMRIGAPRLTRRACPAPVMDAERRFLDTLDEIRAYDIELDENRLILFGARGVAHMTLTRVTD